MGGLGRGALGRAQPSAPLGTEAGSPAGPRPRSEPFSLLLQSESLGFRLELRVFWVNAEQQHSPPYKPGAVPVPALPSRSWDPALKLCGEGVPWAPHTRGWGQLGKQSFSKSGFNGRRCPRVLSSPCWFQVPQPQQDHAAEAPGLRGPASPRVAVSPPAGPSDIPEDVTEPDTSSH